MANEITINPYEEVEGEFTAEEQEALAIGERLAEAEEELLAGKYRSAEELERGYLELQRRMSGKEEPEEEAEEEVEEDDTQRQTEEVPEGFFEALIDAYKSGEWNDDLVQSVENMNSIDVLNLFLDKTGGQTPYVASPSDVQDIQQSVGGPEAYTEMIQWASQNLNENEISLYDAAMDRGDPLTIFFAAQALYARYSDNIGVDGELLTGSAPRATAKGFRSQAELVAAMSDPRYDKDPAYRADIADKLAISDI